MSIWYDIVLVPFLLHSITYWILCGLFFCADYFYLDPTHSNWKLYKQAAITSMFNQICIGVPIQCLLQYPLFYAMEATNHDSVWMTAIRTIAVLLCSNVTFYVIHRCLHIRVFYYAIHYKHHEFVEPVAVGTSYSHPIEYALTNVLFFYLPCICIGISYNMFLVLLSIGTINSILAHTNDQILFVQNDHAVHHKQYHVHFGFGGWMDKLCGTDKKTKQ